MNIISVQNKKKKTQYIIASIIAISVLFIWVSIPLLNKSSWDTSVSNPYGMAKKSGDLSLADSAGVDAPGQPLDGSMIDNPATTLDLEASSLFKMPDSDINYEEDSSQKTTASIDSNVSAPGVSAPSVGGFNGKAKLNKLPSLSGGNSGSLTLGQTHNKFFGQETAKANLVPLNDSTDIKSSKKNFALEALKKAEQNSVMAAKTENADAAKSAASSAFEKTQKFDELFLNSKDEKEYHSSGLEFAEAESDLKKNDPSVSKKKISLPQPSKDEDESKKMEEQMKQMLLQMIIQATLGQVFGAMGQMMAMQICPECYKKKTN
ncbi:MAG: hypothetical protein K6357_06915 [Elusimicrobiota bacterium]